MPKVVTALIVDAEVSDDVLLKRHRLRRPSQAIYLACLLACLRLLRVLGERKPSLSHFDEKGLMFRSCGLPPPIECTQQRCCVIGLSWASQHPFLIYGEDCLTRGNQLRLRDQSIGYGVFIRVRDRRRRRANTKSKKHKRIAKEIEGCASLP